ncbi:hypothetical protein [Sulfurirhabdus autotrophica]|uniref:Secreted protein n=1 Tax=Sulfurirhabdus autotrophica TaxID=1706046 RepID=A0A4R3Y235_9PROT|nr:hypothetical protein [Sulfurirhabdus autotrophica]TCV84083.1 hypothetical protein EDC63_11318 [Sulfurirhabdus autotrophica]
MKLKSLVIAVLLAGMPLATQASLVTKTFISTITVGSLAGSYGTGSFTYDDALVITGYETISALDGLKVNFTFDGQVFNETNDRDYITDPYPALTFVNFQAIDLNYLLANGVNGVSFANSTIQELYISGLNASTNGYDFANTMEVTSVPIPGAIWMLFSGLTGLLVLGNRGKKTNTF